MKWAFQVAHWVKNQPASAGDVGDGVQSLAQEDPLEKEMATCSNILALGIPWTRGPGGYSLWGCKESDTTEVTEHTRMHQGGSGYCFREVDSVVKGSQKTVIYASCSPNIRVQGPSSESFLSHR